MKPGDLIEYQTDVSSWGTGRVVAFDEETEMVTVRDEYDNSTWTGPADRTEPSDE